MPKPPNTPKPFTQPLSKRVLKNGVMGYVTDHIYKYEPTNGFTKIYMVGGDVGIIEKTIPEFELWLKDRGWEITN